MGKVTYVSPEAPKFRTRLSVNGEDRVLQFENKHLVLDEEEDAAAIKEFDRCIAKNPALSQQVKKVDIVAAEAMARAHRLQSLKYSGGVTGPVTTHGTAANEIRAAQEHDRLLAQGMTDEEASAAVATMFPDHKSATVETVEHPQIQEVPKAGEPSKEPSENAEQESIKQTFASLGKK